MDMKAEVDRLNWAVYDTITTPEILTSRYGKSRIEAFDPIELDVFVSSIPQRMKRLGAFLDQTSILTDGSVNGIIELNRFFSDASLQFGNEGFLSDAYAEFCRDVAVFVGEQILTRNSRLCWANLSLSDESANYFGELGVVLRDDEQPTNYELPIVSDVFGYAINISSGMQPDLIDQRSCYFLGEISIWSFVGAQFEPCPLGLSFMQAIEKADLNDVSL